MSVILDEVESTIRYVQSGVIQGSAMGPALFSFFAQDIPTRIGNNASSSLFADDVKLFAVQKDRLMSGVQCASEWSSENHLPLAPGKTIYMRLHRRRSKHPAEPLMIEGVSVPPIAETRDLGIQLRDDLECSSHVTDIVTRAFRVSNLILRILRTKKLHIFKKAFCSLVLPILEYCSAVWCPTYVKDINKVESVLRRFTKRAQYKCGIKSESYSSRLIRWNMKSLEYRRLQNDLIITYKILFGFMDINRNTFFRIVASGMDMKIFPHPVPAKYRNNTQMNSIANRIYQIWNKLPLTVRNSFTVEAFKRRIKQIDLSDKFMSKIKC
jgi:hypothetical protein